jgi:3-deoxy-D-manno-octulosonic-acid transferase
MRLLYSILFFLLVPLVLLRLYWRGIKAPEYRKRWLERLAVYPTKYPQQVIWFHAVSVGEAEAVFPLVKMMQEHHPDVHFLVTFW